MAVSQSELDQSLDRFMPIYDVVERHGRRVRAPQDIVFATVSRMDLERVWIVRALIRARELLMHTKAARRVTPEGFLPRMRALGWGLLSQTAGREIVMGAVTQPWLADVKFRPLPAEQFTTFAEPGYARIMWAIRVDPAPGGSFVYTQTRVAASDAESRNRFRSYWRRIVPGVLLIRLAMLRTVQRDAERAVRKLP